ncbi:helix-turn-helix domain-containing protein [Streptomyces phyllanthi]|uniref:Helix-turn-helix domain-containing protein n=1 Tax=Streptomyces phyllanthi TaxID=1803180 RepID=A0A5N8WHB2_9ACTN|nr:helix-turn-helix transcriptional regulator [Streptomyces phyllanthi]MPY45864.1 helix-turn-helix domain-containing protein [Streptomyces phyllanthi]
MATETAEFAALLLELKERSGRSYGALSARLHVSTSTLHRYCNGTAVPHDYAPVERLAKACGAKTEELVELHRRWILADSARHREPAAAEQGANTTAADAPSEPAAAPAPEPEVEQADPEPEAAAPVEAPAASRSRSVLPRLLSRPKAVIAVAVAAVAVPAAVVAGQPAASSRHEPSAGSSKASVVVDAPRSVTPSPESSPESSPAAGGGSTSTPFHVTVLTDNWGSVCDQWFLLDQSPDTVPPPPVSQEVDGWASALGAEPAGHLRLQLTAQGTGSRPVVLHALYVRVISSRTAPKWNAYTMGTGCGGGLTPASFAIDLDAADPRPEPVPGEMGNAGTPVTDFPYKVSSNDPQVLNIDAGTVGQDVSWYLEMAWSSGGRQGTLRIDDHGRPFHTAGMRGVPRYYYGLEGKDAWVLDTSES